MTTMVDDRAAAIPAKAHDLLSDVFGFADFRDGQADVISRLLEGRSTLAIFPTGGGKSLCYQLPALMLDGLTVVVSPLIALMKDQIDFLVEPRRAGGPARFEPRPRRSICARSTTSVRGGRESALRLAGAARQRAVPAAAWRGSRSACWRSTRPIASANGATTSGPTISKSPPSPSSCSVGRVLALTATATPEVATDIAAAFDIEADDVVQTGFYRPNLELRVTACADDEARRNCSCRGFAVAADRADDRLRHAAADGRARSPPTSPSAASRPAPITPVLTSEERNEIQDAFMAADDMIVVATIAFGMGIDKANIRAVYHFNLPKSLESYMQEIGRAGRDGEPAVCEMLACADDVVTLENFTYGDTPEPETVAALVDELLGLGEQFDVSVYDLAQRHDVPRPGRQDAAHVSGTRGRAAARPARSIRSSSSSRCGRRPRSWPSSTPTGPSFCAACFACAARARRGLRSTPRQRAASSASRANGSSPRSIIWKSRAT